MPRNRAWLAACAVLAACAGQGGDPDPGRDAGAGGGPPFPTALIGDPVEPTARFRLTLDDPGAEPRRLLRYRVPPGSREKARIAISSSTEIFIAGRRINTIKPPDNEVAFELAVAARPGGYRCDGWITQASSTDWERMAPDRGSELKRAVEQLSGHHIAFEVDDRGQPVSRSLTLPDAIESHRTEALQLLKSIDAAVVALPGEPVGIGAVWRAADADPGRSGLAGAVTVIYRLVAIRGDHLELDMTIALPEVPMPLGLGGDEVAGYSSGRSEGSVRVEVDLRRLLPLRFGGRLKNTIEGRTFVGSEVMPFVVTGEATQSLRSR